jgi:hypothetical protein
MGSLGDPYYNPTVEEHHFHDTVLLKDLDNPPHFREISYAWQQEERISTFCDRTSAVWFAVLVVGNMSHAIAMCLGYRPVATFSEAIAILVGTCLLFVLLIFLLGAAAHRALRRHR